MITSDFQCKNWYKEAQYKKNLDVEKRWQRHTSKFQYAKPLHKNLDVENMGTVSYIKISIGQSLVL